MARFLPLFLSCSLLCGCSAGNTSLASVTTSANSAGQDRLLIEAASERWRKAYESGDPDSLANVFTDDAIYAANTGELLRGRSEIKTVASGWMKQLAQVREMGDVRLERQLLRLEQHDSIAYELARFTLAINPPGCLINAGYSMALWEKQLDGQWLVDALTVNRDRDPIENACPR